MKRVPHQAPVLSERSRPGALGTQDAGSSHIITVLWLGFAAVIAYGSVYPFNFQSNPLDEYLLQRFLESCCNRPSRGDVLGNIVLFIPYGLLGVLAAGKHKSLASCAAIVAVSGIVLAFALQVAQIYLPSRDENLQDVAWNLLGILLGIQAGVVSRKYTLQTSNVVGPVDLSSAMLLGSWLVYRLLPFVPSIDLQEIKNSLKPLLLSPQFDAVGTLGNAAAWLAVAGLLANLRRELELDRYLAPMMIAVFTLEILIVKNSISVANVAGALLAAALWFSVMRRQPSRSAMIAALLCLSIVLDGVSPFETRAVPSEFAWIPFRGVLGGSMYVNVQAICEKVFLYGSLLYFLWQTRMGKMASLALATIVITVVEIAQVYVVSHTPEVTDPLLLLLAALTLLGLGEQSTAPAAPGRHVQEATKTRQVRARQAGTPPRLVEREVNLRGLQMDFLEFRSERTGVSEPELVRRIVDEFRAVPIAMPTETDKLDTTRKASQLPLLTEESSELGQEWYTLIVTLRPDQARCIAALAREQGLSESQAIRRIVAWYMDEP